MPNWIKGTMKLRGDGKDILRFLKDNVTRIDDYGDFEIYESEGGFSFTTKLTEKAIAEKYSDPWFYIDGSRRLFITDACFDIDYGNNNEVACMDIAQAWSFSGEDSDIERLKRLSKGYNLDIKLFGIESGYCFTQEVIALRGSERVINNVKRYEDWDWECPFPRMGG